MPIASSSQSLGSMRSTAIRESPIVLGWMAVMYRNSIPRARICQSDFREELFPSKKLHRSRALIGLNVLYIVVNVTPRHSLERVYLKAQIGCSMQESSAVPGMVTAEIAICT